MSITAVGLRNFRGFRETTIDLKPLTVLLGPNSAGKSSFGHALAAMAHAHRSNRGTPQASLTPPMDQDRVRDWPVDLGSTADLRTLGGKGPVRIGLQTQGGWIELGFGFEQSDSSNLDLSYILHPYGDDSATTSEMTESIAQNIPGGRSDVVPLDRTLAQVAAALEVKRVNLEQWQEAAEPVSVLLDGMLVKSYQRETTARALSGLARNEFGSFLDNLTYLRATRKRPYRLYDEQLGKFQQIGYGGEWAPSLLFQKSQERISYLVPPSVPNSADEALKMSYEWTAIEQTLGEAVGAWLSRLDLAQAIESVKAIRGLKLRVTLPNQQPHDITEVGFGVSQVIPVLVAGLLQPKNSLFIVDLPEAHLHPRPQGAIADFFCSLALSGRFALVETHSEMFFHRLRLRAAMNPRLMENIAVYFIDQPSDGVCSSPRPVGLDFESELRWPEGFLLGAWETQAQITAIRKARTGKQ